MNNTIDAGKVNTILLLCGIALTGSCFALAVAIDTLIEQRQDLMDQYNACEVQRYDEKYQLYEQAQKLEHGPGANRTILTDPSGYFPFNNQ